MREENEQSPAGAIVSVAYDWKPTPEGRAQQRKDASDAARRRRALNIQRGQETGQGYNPSIIGGIDILGEMKDKDRQEKSRVEFLTKQRARERKKSGGQAGGRADTILSGADAFNQGKSLLRGLE